MTEYAYYNGVFTPYNAAVIPLSDRSIFFGDAVYDVIVGRGKRLYQFDEHLERLYRNATIIGLENLPDKTTLEDVANELLELCSLDTFMLYIQLSSDAERRIHSRDDKPVNVLMTVTECEVASELCDIKAITLPDLRHRYCDVKTTALLPAVLSVEEAKRQGAAIAIFQRENTVTECSYANVSIVKNGEVITHPYDEDILPGITQINLEGVCERLEIPHTSRAFSVDELYSADAVMITSTTKLIKLCTEIDGIVLAVKDRDTVKRLFDELKEDFTGKTHQET